MHKEYPYLQDSFIYQIDIEREKRNILNEIDSFVNQRQYIKITLLNWDEEPIKAIEGEISSGSISKIGDSPIRRTAQLTCAVDARSYSVDNGKADFAINKKVFIEIGVKNETPHYPEYPIFWFPEGVFFIGSFSINSSANSSTNITLSLKDKMAMLNGDVGGTLPTTVIFDTMDTQLPSGEYIQKKVLIYNIIKELVNHYGGEDLNRIVIEGVPLRIRRIMQWYGDTPLYQLDDVETTISMEPDTPHFSLTKPDSEPLHTFYKGMDVGYIMDDFVIIDELTGAPGETVTAILDKIKNIIGNYEYFYDVFGTFHFREIKNYYVTTQARTLLDEMAENDYLVETNNSRSIYTFDDEKLLTSITVNPQYENIKNDYIVEGQTTIADSDITTPIRYHLAIDKKPRIIDTDTRRTIRVIVDNSKKIEEKTKQLNKLLQEQYANIQYLEQLLYDVRNAKTYIDTKNDLIDVKDKELTKQLQDIWRTAYTYIDLEELKNNEAPHQLYAEAWFLMYAGSKYPIPPSNISYNNLISSYQIKIPQRHTGNLELFNIQLLNKDTQTIYNHVTLVSPNIIPQNNIIYLNNVNNFTLKYDTLIYFIETAEFPELIEVQEQINQLIDEQTSMSKNIQQINTYITKIEEYNTELNDIDKQIYDYAGLTYPENKSLYTSSVEALKIAHESMDKINTQINVLKEQQQQLTKRYANIKKNLVTLYNFILQLQQQRDNKIVELDGKEGIQLGIENNHECLVSINSSNLEWFSHNLDQIVEFESLSNYKYSFIDSNMENIVTLNPNNDYAFYENSLFGEFYNAFMAYHQPNENNQIQQLEQEIADLEANDGTINYNTNLYYGFSYYEVYPTTEDEMILYIHPRNNLVCAAYVENVQELPQVGNFNLIYKQNGQYYYWDGEMYQIVSVLQQYDNLQPEHQYYAYDWRTKLYLDGLKGVIHGTDKGYYFTELYAFWPQVYDLQNQKFYAQEKDKAIDHQTLALAGSYYLDFLDEIDTSFGEWSVNNIGRRSNVIVKEEINCLFQPEIPNVVFLPSNVADLGTIGHAVNDEIYRYGSALESNLNLNELRQEAINNYYPWTQVNSDIYNKLITGGYRNGAFDQIKYELYLHTRYQKSISLTSIPVFYLEPNNRITINDITTNTYGDFVIQSINLTLGPGANMSITCNEIAERF